MKIKYLFLTLLLVSPIFFLSCSDDEEQYIPIAPAISPISVNLATVPYSKLSDYHFFEGEMKDQVPALNLLPYKPASGLFTDYAHKKRFVWMPSGTKATYNGDAKVLELPVGSALVKTFYYDNVQPSNTTRIIETRVMIRKATGWIFAEYVWNDEQTEANLQMNGSYTNITWEDVSGNTKSANYRIPSETECLTCHKSNEIPIPIGIKPQNLNTLYNFETGSKNQLEKWIEMGYLVENIPANIVFTIDYEDTTQDLTKRVRSYVDINCAHCHQSNSHCDYRAMRFAFSETANNTSNLGVCLNTEDLSVNTSQTKIVSGANVNRSMMYYRLNTENESFRMPLLGRTIIHTEGVAMIQQWINTLPACN